MSQTYGAHHRPVTNTLLVNHILSLGKMIRTEERRQRWSKMRASKPKLSPTIPSLPTPPPSPPPPSPPPPSPPPPPPPSPPLPTPPQPTSQERICNVCLDDTICSSGHSSKQFNIRPWMQVCGNCCQTIKNREPCPFGPGPILSDGEETIFF